MNASEQGNPPATILVVDDDPGNLSVVGGLLAPQYRVQVANSGPRALELMRQQPRPDLVLLDIMMPELDGYAVLEQIKADPATRLIPVIFLTAMDSSQDEEKGLALGAVDYITKPIHPTIVLARVRTHLELKRARDALASQNAWLEAEVARRMQDNELIQDVSIRALARLAEVRDMETGHHIQRTALYVQLLANLAASLPRFAGQIDAHLVTLLTKSAPLHDIGKVGIPDHILHKPGKLDAQEWAVMQTHAELGARAIELAERDTQHSVEFLAVAKQIAHWHHENWDGSGYPDRLVGDAIPLAARLMRIADVFDALISRRVYKPAWEPSEVKRTMAEGRGTLFDPDLADLLDRHFGEFVAIAERLRDPSDVAMDPAAVALTGA